MGKVTDINTYRCKKVSYGRAVKKRISEAFALKKKAEKELNKPPKDDPTA